MRHKAGAYPYHRESRSYPGTGNISRVEWTGRETVVFADTENLGNVGIVTDAVCSLKVGDMCYLALDKQFIHFFDGETGGRI